ncbi:hypothetical protein GWI33_010135, partial [Rhynchophorus ferrugineus]
MWRSLSKAPSANALLNRLMTYRYLDEDCRSRCLLRPAQDHMINENKAGHNE